MNSNLDMASYDRVMQLEFRGEAEDRLILESYDWSLPRAFQLSRHLEKIEGIVSSPQCWRMKERMKTVSVALVMCLNVGVDPPGIIKTHPCARLECWIDPMVMNPQKSLENIGAALQKQYERWQPRARYKQSLDPTLEEVKKLCTSLRRNAKDEKVLFHYNGHGVPLPTTNGEIWVFNRNYTQYIPLSIYDLQTWMGSPSIYVYDCSHAGLIIKSFHQFAEQHQKEYEEMKAKSNAFGSCSPPNFNACIQLAACLENQILPMNPDLPADLFTSCLTTPIRTALRWFILQNKDKLVPKINLDMVEKVPGQLNDRRTMLGELNWIFTAITDTIAWNVLPRHLFQKLFRQDLLVASLFRNFLLAERIMRTYDCTPTSSPKLPPTFQHPMWQAWDYALDLSICQLPGILEELGSNQSQSPQNPSTPAITNGSNTNTSNNTNGVSEQFANHIPSPFFEEQLTAFEVWLTLGNEKRAPPEQLPIVLQVLLSQVHRVRALELLGRFLDLGWWAVNLALSVGIFPYVLKLLQSSARELRPLLVFIWAKILAVDHTCQTDLVRDGCHKYFISMIGDTSLPFEHRTLAVFVLTNIVRNFRSGQQAALTANAISTLLLALDENDTELRRWVCICLGLTWSEFSAARWVGVRDSAHEKIYSILEDPNPEVRAAAMFALGTFMNSASERTEHSNSIDHSVAAGIISKVGADECSPLVRQEMVVALHNFVLVFESVFVSIEQQNIINQELLPSSPAGGSSGLRRISSQARMKILANVGNSLATVTGAESHIASVDSMRRVASSGSLSTMTKSCKIANQFSPFVGGPAVGGINGKVWAAMIAFERDPYPGVSLLARTVMDYIRLKAREAMTNSGSTKSNLMNSSHSSTGSSVNNTPVRTGTPGSSSSPDPNGGGDGPKPKEIVPLIATKYVEWCWDRFARPNVPGNNGIGMTSTYSANNDVVDSQNPIYHTREWRYMRNARVRKDCFRRSKPFPGRIDELMFNSKNVSHSFSHTPSSSVASSPSFNFSSSSCPSLVKLHDYGRYLVTSELSMFSLYDVGENPRLIAKCENSNDSRITCLEWVNVHDDSLVLVGADDGSARFWLPDHVWGKCKMITAWNALPDLSYMTKSSRTYGLILKWDYEKERVLATGNAKMIKVWDANKEMKLGDWPTGFDCPATCIDIHRCEPQIAVIGAEEGAIRVIDFRLPPADSGVVSWREFGDSCIIGTTLRYDRSVVAGSSNGKVRFFDLRSRAPTKTVDTLLDVTAFSVHPHLPYFACGCFNHSVNVYGFLGQSVFSANTIRDGLFLQGRGAVSSLHFHPYKPALATVDAYSVNVYKAKGAPF